MIVAAPHHPVKWLAQAILCRGPFLYLAPRPVLGVCLAVVGTTTIFSPLIHQGVRGHFDTQRRNLFKNSIGKADSTLCVECSMLDVH
jgi:hypothetical protein